MHPDKWRVGLGHRRLSILDLSSAGHQPMRYRQHLWITFNGEIYNFVELRADLTQLGHSFHSTSDTEVILAAYLEWGPQCFARLRGMWSLLIYDASLQRLVICRDRLGIKPLYLWQNSELVAFASEIKQFLVLPGFRPTMNLETCALYLLTGYENPIGSMFQDVQQIPPGCWTSLDLNTGKLDSPHSYWHPERVTPAISDPAEAGQLFGEKLGESVRIHMRSDVPVGCALSGGLDSSAIAVVIDELHRSSRAKLRTFSAVFPGFVRDERNFIDVVLQRISAEPFFVTPEYRAFLDDLRHFVWTHDEPVGGLPQYSAYCVSRLTRQMKVPVTLNGQGGDEVLGGYWQLYFTYLVNLLRTGRWFGLARHFLGSLLPSGNSDLLAQAPVMWKRFRARTRQVSPIRLRGVNDKHLLGLSKARRYLQMTSQEQRVAQIRELFLPQLLKWDDRNFMAFSVEGRYPFLDHELIELCLQFEPRLLYSNGWTKWPLRTGLDKSLPHEICYRRSKFSFEAPQDDWLCAGIRPEVEAWLKSDRPLWLWVDSRDARTLAETVWASRGTDRELGQALFRLFVFDRWLEVFGVSPSPG